MAIKKLAKKLPRQRQTTFKAIVARRNLGVPSDDHPYRLIDLELELKSTGMFDLPFFRNGVPAGEIVEVTIKRLPQKSRKKTK